MNDTELSPTEDTRLRQLLQRAAEGVEVPTATSPASLVPQPERRRAPWVLAAAAAIVLLGGGLWLTTGGDGDRIDTGPATVGEDLPPALRETGIWRLPTELPPGNRIGAAYVTTTSRPVFQLAVDDPEAPSRWLALWPVGVGLEEFGELEPARVEGGGDEATITLFRPDVDSFTGSTWIEVQGARQTWSAVIAFRGVPEEEAMTVARELAADVGSTSDLEVIRTGLRQVRVPDGLEPTWDPALIGHDPDRTDPTGLALVLVDESSTDGAETSEVMTGSISMHRTDLPPTLASLAARLEMETSANIAPAGAVLEVPLDDVAPGAYLLTAQDVEYPTVFSVDGVLMTLSVAPGAGSSWSPGESLRTLLSLRAMTEQELRDELATRGIELQDSRSLVDGEAAASGNGSTSVSGPTVTTGVPVPGSDELQTATTVDGSWSGGVGPTTTVAGSSTGG